MKVSSLDVSKSSLNSPEYKSGTNNRLIPKSNLKNLPKKKKKKTEKPESTLKLHKKLWTTIEITKTEIIPSGNDGFLKWSENLSSILQVNNTS